MGHAFFFFSLPWCVRISHHGENKLSLTWSCEQCMTIKREKGAGQVRPMSLFFPLFLDISWLVQTILNEGISSFNY